MLVLTFADATNGPRPDEITHRSFVLGVVLGVDRTKLWSGYSATDTPSDQSPNLRVVSFGGINAVCAGITSF